MQEEGRNNYKLQVQMLLEDLFSTLFLTNKKVSKASTTINTLVTDYSNIQRRPYIRSSDIINSVEEAGLIMQE